MAIIDRIKFDGMKNGKEWLVYRYPGDSFVAVTQLIVGEGQVAVFVKGGQALDYFTAGTHTLSTSNIPLLQGIINFPFGGKTPYTAEIYFINKTTKLDINWGTIDPIQLIDPKYQIKLRIRAFGQFGMKVDDYRVLLTELIGTLSPLEVVNYAKMINYFKGILVMKVKAAIAEAIIHKGISALEISASLDDISDFSKDEISEEFSRFGLKVVNFYIQSINFPDEDFAEINRILSDKASFDIIGNERYVTKRSFDTLETAAGNTGGVAGAMTGAGIGLGMGVGIGGAMPGLVGNMNTAAPKGIRCPKCNEQNDDGNSFCGGCGAKLTSLQVKCTNCGEKVDPDDKFCTSCGNSMVKKLKCTNCGTENDEATKFCKECGTKMEV